MVSFSLTRAGENVAVVFSHCGVKMKISSLKLIFMFSDQSVKKDEKDSTFLTSVSSRTMFVQIFVTHCMLSPLQSIERLEKT